MTFADDQKAYSSPRKGQRSLHEAQGETEAPK